MSAYKFTIIPTNLVEFMWPFVMPYLQRIIDLIPEEICEETLLAKFLSGEHLMLVVLKEGRIKAVLDLEFRTYGTGYRTLTIPIVTGDDMDDWGEELHAELMQFAKFHQCSELRGIGARKGWLRKAAHLGWEEAYAIIKCKVE